VERNLDLLEGKDPEASRQKQPLQPSMRQNESHTPGHDDNTGQHKAADVAALDRCPPIDGVPASGVGTPAGQQMQPPGDSEENVPRGAAAMDTSPDTAVRSFAYSTFAYSHGS
jgi:hypothetical protein